MLKIFTITTHCSEEYCSNGNLFLDKCLKSLYTLSPNKVIIVDNQSTIKPDINLYRDKLDIDYIYVENQKLRGLTGAWNIAIEKAISYGSSIICNCNNDIVFDSSYQNIFDAIKNDPLSNNTIYGPKTNNPGWQTKQLVFDKNEYLLSGDPNPPAQTLNEFCLFFTSEFYDLVQNDGLFFYNEKERPWGGQHRAMTYWKNKYNTNIKILNNCFVYHKKDASWRKVLSEK